MSDQKDLIPKSACMPLIYHFSSEGMAFALTAKDNIGSGLAILIAMIVRVVPMKLGYAQILSKSGLRSAGFKSTRRNKVENGRRFPP